MQITIGILGFLLLLVAFLVYRTKRQMKQLKDWAALSMLYPCKYQIQPEVWYV